ncbi:nucleotidyltransferase domain-containing protein [Merismopedia glauca]|uniref:Nucleotidyltransferase family protein n=1 Tax=Merismopedia glauca CCAP 1448/3 TaxID=1296344 RepID=A0A2T1C5B4_9CYAN|nr:nucleotidyltransferase family protein [Merismopedia glauca]PSB03313.1 hypothetical protein C7B64_09055 [Merismopedia glauca CCAP 1448/3]
MTLAIPNRPEEEVLFCCARTSINVENSDRLHSLLKQNLDWNYLLEIAPLHGMIPLLYTHLKNSSDAVPEKVFKQLQTHFEGNAKRNLFLAGELIKTLDLFKQHQIEAIPFKGPTLAISIYGNLAMRQFGDLDILIHPKDVLKAKEILLNHGYKPPTSSLTKAQESAYLKSAAEYNFISQDCQVSVETHWGIVPGDFSLAFPPELFWEDLQPVTIGERKVLSFSPENLLLVLCIQRSKHLWERLDWICDIAEVVRNNPQLNWDKVIDKATQIGCQRMLYLGVYLAKEFLKLEVPEAVWTKVENDSKIEKISLQVSQSLFTQQRERSPLGYRRVLFHLASRERLRDRIQYGWRLATVPTQVEWMRSPLPDSLYFLYYFLRPIRLIKTHKLRPLQYLN